MTGSNQSSLCQQENMGFNIQSLNFYKIIHTSPRIIPAADGPEQK